MVVVLRYIAGEGIENWSLLRRIVSRGTTLLTQMLLPPVEVYKDMVSGFFGFRRNIIDGIELNPKSFKILLEVSSKFHIILQFYIWG
ncbi:MAG: hypothetical protein QXK88_09480 [Desulfurococcaceae archaeon]